MALPDAFFKAREKYFGGVRTPELLHWRYRELHPNARLAESLLKQRS